MASHMAAVASLLQNLQIPAGVEPAIVHLPSPPKLEGPLAPNNWLAKVRRHAVNKVQGPESMLIVNNGHIFTGTADGYLVHIKPDGSVDKLRRFPTPRCGQAGERPCGRPMGIRLDKFGLLVVADAHYGIYRINQYTGETVLLVDATSVQVNGRPVGFVNDLAVSRDGALFFTSSSTKWPLSMESNIIFEAENTGRVLKFKDGKVSEIVSNLSFPTGLELSGDGSYLLIGEGTFSRIWRAWVGDNAGAKKNVLEVFSTNLPGVVANIRRSPRGNYWVALSQARHSQLPSVLDTKGDDRMARAALIWMVNRKVSFEAPKFGIVVELDRNGNIVRSLQDPTGAVYTGVSEVQENDRFIFFASPNKNYIGFLNVNDLNTTIPGFTHAKQSIISVTATNSTSKSNATKGAMSAIPASGSLNSNPRFLAFINTVRQNVDKMNQQVLKQAVVDVVRELMACKYQSLLLRRMVEAREAIVLQMQRALHQKQQVAPPTETASAGKTNGSTGGVTTKLPVTPAPGSTGGVTTKPPVTPAPGSTGGVTTKLPVTPAPGSTGGVTTKLPVTPAPGSTGGVTTKPPVPRVPTTTATRNVTTNSTTTTTTAPTPLPTAGDTTLRGTIAPSPTTTTATAASATTTSATTTSATTTTNNITAATTTTTAAETVSSTADLTAPRSSGTTVVPE